MSDIALPASPGRSPRPGAGTAARPRATRDLFVSTFAPTLGTGRALRTYTCVRALAMLGPVDLAYVPLGGEGPSPEYEAIPGVEFHTIVASRGLRRARVYAGKRLRGVPDECARGVSPELIEEASRLATVRGRGRIVVGDLNAATALLPLARRRAVTYNAHNVNSAMVTAGGRGRPGVALAMRTYERRLLKAAAESWMVSRADLEAAHRLVPEARLRYVPNVVDAASIRPVAPHPPGRRLLMVGDFLYEPNRTGRAFLLDEVLPRVWRELPDARLTLVGRGLDGFEVPDPRVEVAGFVDELPPVYAATDCVAVPLVEGGGSPLKFVEALAYGLPVVATPFAARGLDVVAGEHYLEAPDAAAFAAAVVGVLRDGAREVAARARRMAETSYSVEALAELIAA